MMQKILYPLLLVFVMLFASCQKEIEVDIPDYEQKIVIEGSIEAGDSAMVMVSRSISYFANIDLQTLLHDVLISDAIVTLKSSTGEVEQLDFMYYPESPVYFAYVGHMKGVPGRTYTLTVQYEGKEYVAHTSMCEPVRLDSAWLHFFDENDTSPTSRI